MENSFHTLEKQSKEKPKCGGNKSEELMEPTLANWKKWLNIHRRQQHHLSDRTNRPPQCLLMNSNFNNLYVNQEKRILAEAGDFQHCDKYSGHPNFWKTGDNFKADGKSLGVYQTLQKRYDRSLRRQITNQCPELVDLDYVGIPDVIFQEMGLSGKPCLPTSKEKWDQSEYVKKRKHMLKEKLELIQKHTPSLSNIAVIGVPIDCKTISEDQFHDNSTDIENELTYTCRVSSYELSLLSIDKPFYFISVVIDNNELLDNKHSWVVNFDECYVFEKYTKTVKISNLQNDSCLRYCWETVLPKWADCEFPLKHVKRNSNCYFFDKNEGVILPNDELKLDIQFESLVAGVFCENWVLYISQCPDEWNPVTVQLQAVTIEQPNRSHKLDEIDAYIESCTKLTIARKTVEEILQRTRPEPADQLPYNWKFFEEQIFLHNNPDLFYDNKLVYKLKELHDQISIGPWDFSMSNMREKLLKLPLNEDLRSKIEQFTNITYQLMKPSSTTHVGSEKHKTVHELLCCFFNRMESESMNLLIVNDVIVSRPSENLDRLSLIEEDQSEVKGTVISLSKKASSMQRASKLTNKSSKSTFVSSQALNSGDSGSSICYKSSTKRKQEYLDAFYIKTYALLGQTIDHISAFIDSFNMQNEITALNSLKLARPYQKAKDKQNLGNK